MLGLSAGVTIKNDRFGGTFQNIGEILETGSEIHRLYIGFPLAG